jgi:hypothetical protein
MGYQFKVNYDSSKVSATGAFINTFFNTSIAGGNAYIAWNADCSTPGVCKFSVAKTNATGGEVNGSGTLAQITFTGLTPGVVPLTFSEDVLSDRNGYAILHTAGTGVLNVYGFATISGKVYLQGRGALVLDAGTVKLTDVSGDFAPVTVNYSDGDNWTATVPVSTTGTTTYNLLASHSVYLSNEKTGVAVTTGGTFEQPATLLKGGDANNSGMVEVGDLSCIGAVFGVSVSTCGGTGSSDINHDGTTNILDLTITGGNFDLPSPQAW